MGNQKVLFGKGKQYSEVAEEVEKTFKSWIMASEITEDCFMQLVQQEDLHLTFYSEDDVAITILHHGYGEIATPLIWQRQNGISLESYKLDTALVLLYVAARCQNEESKKKIKDFVRKNLQ